MTDNEDRIDERELLEVARRSIEAHLARRDYHPEQGGSKADITPPNGVFVTLYDEEKQLRGCIGRLERSRPTVAEEIADCAVSAAVHDPRFPAVTPGELPRLGIEISLLSRPEKVHDATRELDPLRYGLIMTAARSGRQGTLLPGIEGIDSVEQQLAALRRKAGIRPDEPVELYRYTVRKIRE